MDARERASRRANAQDCFTRAANAALDGDDKSLTSALLFALMGIAHICAADGDGRIVEAAEKLAQQYRGRA